MKKWLLIVFALALIFASAFNVSAATGASSVSCYATVASDESCQVTLSVTLHLENAVDSLKLPLPAQATNITVNGSRVRAGKSGDVRNIDLGKVMGNLLGDFSLAVNYTLPDVVIREEEGGLSLQLPLLSGFAYGISNMDFSVTMPGQITGDPIFSSGYHQTDIEKDMVFSVDGAMISGRFQAPLKDHETLVLSMGVTEEMFPQPVVQLQNTDFSTVAMIVCAVLALLYWVIFLRCLPLWRQASTQPPQGHTAGELGCILCQQGADLSLMVLTWAQLGYLLILPDRSGRVILQKQMEMGNERSETELRIWRSLFAKRDRVDTGSIHYAQLVRAVSKKSPGLQELIRPTSGNPTVLRGILAGIGLFGGAGIGILLSGGSALSILWVVLLAALGAVSCYSLLGWGCKLFLRGSISGYVYLAVCLSWLLLGIAAEAFAATLWLLIGILFASLFYAYGGRRTSLGRQSANQILGLRRYLRTVSKTELQRICAENPEYFHQVAPYAVALNVHKRFARRFGRQPIPACPYIRYAADSTLPAARHSIRLEQLLKQMDRRAKLLPLEKLLELVASFRK